MVLTDLPGQELSLEVFDKDMDMKDDFMGRLLYCKNTRHFISTVFAQNSYHGFSKCYYFFVSRLEIKLNNIIKARCMDEVNICLLPLLNSLYRHVYRGMRKCFTMTEFCNFLSFLIYPDCKIVLSLHS